MENWEILENNCFDYLNLHFGSDNVNFDLMGKHDSTKSDIKCFINNDFKFYIEVKGKEAQSGQFVLLDNGSNFEYSPRNKSEINIFSNLILDYINDNYDVYKHACDGSLSVDLPKDVFMSWILNYYSNKNVRYVITKDNSNYIIFPLDKYGDYFRITANFRPKGSGSSPLPLCDKDIVSRLVNSNYGECSIYYEGKKGFCSLNSGSISHKSQLKSIENNRRYQFNEVASNKYEIRKLSNTRNTTFIFSVKLISKQSTDDLNIFKSEFI
ncbi:TPA: hypothetical protein ACG3RH_002923 [Clostridioides difficile]